jgi:phosphoribosyl-ATP pyrophosphohydrolase
MSYHKKIIQKGILGKSSKIQEELEELLDAEEQSNKILAMCELADLYGALEACTKDYGLTMDDLKEMADATARAFQSGSRK